MNTSGIQPLGYRVLLLPDPVSETFEAAPSIIRADQTKETEKYAMTKATVIAVGPLAWAEDAADARNYGIEITLPVPCSRVKAGKYVGDQFDGDDGKRYTLCNDEDVTALLSE